MNFETLEHADAPCGGRRPPDCMLRHIEQDAASGDVEAAKVLDYEPGACCEDCSHAFSNTKGG